ncbi:MAG TPA: aldo/keto reductase [Polyangia bacterium]|nr:aldo/keto reductase [Polyangia bacterium]
MNATGEIPRRKLGKTGAEVSALGLGGHHLGDLPTAADAARLVHEAIDAGITFFDNCWEYHNGRSELWMGEALRGRRDKVFLMTKVCTHGRDGALGTRMLDQSLRRLETDHLDLWQIHGVAFESDPRLAFAKGGIVEAMERARKAGKVRFVGFTGHKDPALHLAMLEHGFHFDAVQLPLNPFDAQFAFSFERQVLPELTRRGIAPLGMKSLGGRADAVRQGVVSAADALSYAMSLPVATTISGMDSLEVLRQNLGVARGFTPLSPAAMQAIRERCRGAAGDGRFELYKMSLKYDNPQARRAHHFPVDDREMEVKEELAAVKSTGKVK